MNTTYNAYPAYRFIEIVKAWVNHPWPMTPDEGRQLYERLGYKTDREDQDMFYSPFANRGPDSFFTHSDNSISDVVIAVGERNTIEEENSCIEAVTSRYSEYCKATEATFNETIRRRQKASDAMEWFLDNDVQIRIDNVGIMVSLTLHSPRMTQIRREEEEMGLTNYDDIFEDD